MAVPAIAEVLAPTSERLANDKSAPLQTSTQAARSGWAPTPGRKPVQTTGVAAPEVVVAPPAPLAAALPATPALPAPAAADGGWAVAAPDEFVNQPPFDSGLKQGLEHRRLAAIVGMAPGQILVESDIPVLRNLGVTLASAGRLVSSPFTLVGGVLTLDGELAKDGLEDFARGLLGLLGLEQLVMGEYIATEGSGLTGSLAAPRPYAAAIINSKRKWREFSRDDEENGMKGWHTLSNESLAAHAGLTELPWLWLGGILPEVEPKSAANEIKAQTVPNWLADSTGDVVANTVGLLAGLFLPESQHVEFARVMSRLIPGPKDPNPEGIDLGTSGSQVAE